MQSGTEDKKLAQLMRELEQLRQIAFEALAAANAATVKAADAEQAARLAATIAEDRVTDAEEVARVATDKAAASDQRINALRDEREALDYVAKATKAKEKAYEAASAAKKAADSSWKAAEETSKIKVSANLLKVVFDMDVEQVSKKAEEANSHTEVANKFAEIAYQKANEAADHEELAREAAARVKIATDEAGSRANENDVDGAMAQAGIANEEKETTAKAAQETAEAANDVAEAANNAADAANNAAEAAKQAYQMTQAIISVVKAKVAYNEASNAAYYANNSAKSAAEASKRAGGAKEVADKAEEAARQAEEAEKAKEAASVAWQAADKVLVSAIRAYGGEVGSSTKAKAAEVMLPEEAEKALLQALNEAVQAKDKAKKASAQVVKASIEALEAEAEIQKKEIPKKAEVQTRVSGVPSPTFFANNGPQKKQYIDNLRTLIQDKNFLHNAVIHKHTGVVGKLVAPFPPIKKELQDLLDQKTDLTNERLIYKIQNLVRTKLDDTKSPNMTHEASRNSHTDCLAFMEAIGDFNKFNTYFHEHNNKEAVSDKTPKKH